MSSPNGEDIATSKPSRQSPIDWDEHLRNWNRIAQEHDLPEIRSLSDTRRKKLRARLNGNGDFWGEVEKAIATKRGQWAREKRFPSFDQIIRPEILDRLLEGNYAETGWRAKERKFNPETGLYE